MWNDKTLKGILILRKVTRYRWLPLPVIPILLEDQLHRLECHTGSVFDRIDILVPPFVGKFWGSPYDDLRDLRRGNDLCWKRQEKNLTGVQVGCSDDQPSNSMDTCFPTIISTQPYIYRMPVIGTDRVRVGVTVNRALSTPAAIHVCSVSICYQIALYRCCWWSYVDVVPRSEV